MKSSFRFEEIFQYNQDAVLRKIPDSVWKDAERGQLFDAMFLGDYYDGHSIDISKFLRPDLSINLEKLELAISLAIEFLETNTQKNPLQLGIRNITQYCELRGIENNPKQINEEYNFIKNFMQAVASNEASRNINVDYVT